MAKYVIAMWNQDGTGPVLYYKTVGSASKAVDGLINQIKWTASTVTSKGSSLEDQSYASVIQEPLAIARAWVPSNTTPKVTVNIGKYEIEAYKVI